MLAADTDGSAEQGETGHGRHGLADEVAHAFDGQLPRHAITARTAPENAFHSLRFSSSIARPFGVRR